MSIRLASWIGRRFAHSCVGCGSKLVAPLSRSTTKPKGDVLSVQAKADAKLSELYTQLSEEQLRALHEGSASQEGFEPSEAISKPQIMEQLSAQRRIRASGSRVCKPCVMAREGTETPINPPQHQHKEQLGRLFRVMDALDFPLGLPVSSAEGVQSSGGDVFVINRCDLIVSHASQLPKLKRYFMETVFKKLGVPADRVVLTSASRKWHLQKLSELFVTKPKRNYFVGPTNSGKTRLVHELCGIPQLGTTGGPTTWPLPFTTQHSLEYRSLMKYRAKVLIDTPSDPFGSSALMEIVPNVIRKTCAGTRMTMKDPKYKLPVVKAKTGQVVSIGGLAAIEFPRLESEAQQIPVHTFVGIGGLAHTEYARAISSMAKVAEINSSMNEAHLKMRIHDHVGLELHPLLQFHPDNAKSPTKPSVLIKSLGYLQPAVFGNLPKDYRATVWAPKGTQVGLRPEILPNI